MSELGNFVFDVPGKGKTLEAYLQIAIGEREAGLEILKEYIKVTKEGLTGQARLQNLKLQKSLKDAEDVFEEVQTKRELFPQNARISHNHKGQIRHVNFSTNSNYMTTICEKESMVWKVKESVMGCVVNSPHRKEAESEDGVSKPLAAVMDSGERYVVYRGSMTLHIYEIVDDGGSRSTKKVDTIDLVKEI